MKMNNEERILRYFSGLMSDDEKIKFEKELNDSKELNSLKEKIKSHLIEIKKLNVSEIDETYFSHARVNVMERIAVVTLPKYKIRRYAIAVSLIISFVVVARIFNPFESKEISIENFNVNEYFKTTDEYDLRDFEENYFHQVDDYSIEEKLNYINRNSVNSFELYQVASEFDDIVTSIENKKIL